MKNFGEWRGAHPKGLIDLIPRDSVTIDDPNSCIRCCVRYLCGSLPRLNLLQRLVAILDEFNFMESLNSYLSTAKKRWERCSGEYLICIGNEALDLDSAVCSILYAYHLSILYAKEDVGVVPVLNLSKSDFRLRTETTFLFKTLGLSMEHLLFLEDMQNLNTLIDEERLKVALVDHNIPTGVWTSCLSLVTHILDHHQDVFTGHPTSPKTLKVKDIVAVGSCATLVAEQFFNASPSCIDSHIATLLLAPILIDTANFDKTLARGTSRDRDMADKLLATGITHFASADRLFQATQDAKTDISSLNTTDLLRKDYKEWKSGSVSYGMSSLLIPVSEFLGRDPLVGSSIESFYNNQKLDILIIMSVFSRDGSFHRQLGMYSQSERLRNFIVEHCKDQVKLQPLETAPMNGWQAFSQGDLSSSRKQLQPLVGSILSKY